MGVRGLQTFLRRYSSDACCSRVHLPTEIERYRNEHGVDEAEIVVDAQSCYSMWYESLDWTIGFEVQELLSRLRNFVDDFENMHAKLVFFIGGVTPENKRRTWLNRRIDRMQKNSSVFDRYKSGDSFKDIPIKLNSIPPNMTNFVAFVLKYVLCCTVYVTVGEADEGIINYVHENESFAIFAHDTDFVISHVRCVTLCAESFDPVDLTTLLYDRRELCRELNIRRDRLPLLAILAGNDQISYRELESFHREICNWAPRSYIPYDILMPAIGDYIRNELPSQVSCDRLMEMVCNDVFHSCSRMYQMKSAYQSYFVKDEDNVSLSSDHEWNQVLYAAQDRLKNVLLPVTAWAILSKQVYESSVGFEDFRRINDSNENPAHQPSATVTLPLRQRLYGILLYEIGNSDPVVTEWCAENSQSYQAPEMAYPVYPLVDHPGLRALWDPERANLHFYQKWNLFLYVVSPNIHNIRSWLELPHHMVIPTAVCYYLYKEEFLNELSLDAVLVTLVAYRLYGRRDLNAIVVGRPNLRASLISMTYSRTYSLIFSSMASCGFPSPLHEGTYHTTLEGKLLQKMYRETKRETPIDELCQYNVHCLQLFCQMKNIIVSG